MLGTPTLQGYPIFYGISPRLFRNTRAYAYISRGFSYRADSMREDKTSGFAQEEDRENKTHAKFARRDKAFFKESVLNGGASVHGCL